MKKLTFALMLLMAIFGACRKTEPIKMGADAVLHAEMEGIPSTKTVMDEDNNVLWSAGDQILAFMKTSLGLKYKITPESVGKTSARFTKIASSESDDLYAGTELPHNVAYYPYSNSITCRKSGENYELAVFLPSEQTYAPKSFGNGNLPMVAISEDNDITFNNVCGGIKLRLKGTCKVASIEIVGKNNEKLSGEGVITAYTDERKPDIAMSSNASTSITLNCGSGVQLNERIATDFIIICPPTIFTKGFKVMITDTSNGRQTIESNKSNEVLRASLLVMPEKTLETSSIIETIDLSESGTANCYIVSKAGSYQFTPTKGNSTQTIDAIASVEVLWESYGTNVAPSIGDLICKAEYQNGVISFETPSTFSEGNAVIAAKNSNGTILWSWHIWLTDIPEEHVYYNNAGTMMDRNLGATSSKPGDVTAFGLLYQWGRKDPFLGSSDINKSKDAVSTITWPGNVLSNSKNGTIDYAVAHPTTFIKANQNNFDWCYEKGFYADNTRWSISMYKKTIYDPCPVNWRIPDGGEDGIWATASDSEDGVYWDFDLDLSGMNCYGVFGDIDKIWYPAAGARAGIDLLFDTGSNGLYWSASATEKAAETYMTFNDWGEIKFTETQMRSYAASVRCVKE